MASPNDINTRMSKISKSFQTSLNKRLDKMSFKDQSGEEYEEKAGIHPDKYVYFVQRDEDTIELWKGDTQISGQGGGGDWTVVNSLLLESASVAAVTGGVNGSRFMVVNDGDTFNSIDTPSYGQHSGDFKLTTRGKPAGGAGWTTFNPPSGNFPIIYNYQLATSCTSQSYIGSSENQDNRYPTYILNLIRNGVRETLTLKVFQIFCHTSEYPYQDGSKCGWQYYDNYDDTYNREELGGYYTVIRTGVYVERTIENGATTHGYYAFAGYHRHVNSILSVNITNIHYDSTLNAVVGTPYIYEEYTKAQSCAGQLGLRRDLTDGSELVEPYVEFNVNHPQNYANEFIMYRILKGQSIS